LRRLIILLSLPLLAGCARSPAQRLDNRPRQRLAMEMRVAGRIDPGLYYFFAIDTNGNLDDGPVPLVMTPSTPMPASGVPLVISDTVLPPSDYVVFHGGVFQHYRSGRFVGPPYQYAPPSGDGDTISITLDRSGLANPAVASLQLNFVTADQLIPSDDPLTPLDVDAAVDPFLSVPTGPNATYENSAPTGGLPNDDLDIVYWRVEIRND